MRGSAVWSTRGVAVVADDDVEGVRRQVLELKVDGAASDAQVPDDALVPKLDQRFKRPIRRCALFEGYLFGIVKVNQLEPVQAEPLEAFLHGAADPVSGEVAGSAEGIHLGGHNEAFRKAARVGQCLPDPPFTVSSVAVLVGGVDEVEWAFHDPADGGDGGIRPLRRGVAAQGAGSHANG